MSRTLVLAERVLAGIEAECLAHDSVETGGVLPGRVVTDRIIVPFTIPAGPGALQAAARFSPDSPWQQTLLDYLYTRFRVDYVGDWHRHPGRFDQPSAHDLRTARQIVTDPTWSKPEAVFPIAVIDGGRVRLRAYLMQRTTLQFEEIPITVVPDSDPLMRAVLTGMDAPPKEEIHADPPIVDPGRMPRRHLARRFLRRMAAGLRHLSRI